MPRILTEGVRGPTTALNIEWWDLCQSSIWFYVNDEYSIIWRLMPGRKVDLWDLVQLSRHQRQPFSSIEGLTWRSQTRVKLLMSYSYAPKCHQQLLQSNGSIVSVVICTASKLPECSCTRSILISPLFLEKTPLLHLSYIISRSLLIKCPLATSSVMV